VRTAEGNFRLSFFSVHRDHGMALVPLVMFGMIDAATLLYEPFSKCAAFHASIIRFKPVNALCIATQIWGKDLHYLAALALICINHRNRNLDSNYFEHTRGEAIAAFLLVQDIACGKKLSARW
jgi:hypothetical protein